MGNFPFKWNDNPRPLDNPAELQNSDCSRNLVVSLCDYPSHGLGPLTMLKGEKLSVISDDGDFLMVKSSSTGCESYVPTSYTAKVTNRWLFMGISRQQAEELLRLSDNRPGAFMVRESQTSNGGYSLSVLSRSRPGSTVPGSVKHYRIHHIQNGWFYISPGTTFPSLAHLVGHYAESPDGLCSPLGEPCFIQGASNHTEIARSIPVPVRRPTFNWKDISRSMIFRRNRTDSENSLVSEGLRQAISSYLYMTENEQDSLQSWCT